MTLRLRAGGGLVVDPVVWHVDGAPVGAPVRLQLSATDAAGRRWRSSDIYPVGADQTLEIDDPDRPWWGMELVDPAPPTTFTADVGGWTATARVSLGDETSTDVHVERRYAREVDTGVRAGAGWVLDLYLPERPRHPGSGVLLVGGSTGMAAMAPRAALLASHGYPAAVLGYMQEPDLPPALDRIPVEVLAAALEGFPEAERVAVWSVSVGTGLALAALAAPSAPPVAAVVAVAPTDVVWQALGADGPPPRRSSLSRGGQELPWLSMRGELVLPQMVRNVLLRALPGRPRSTALRLHEVYAHGRRDAAAVERASIAVECIAAPLLIVAGAADAMWPAAAMAARLHQRRRQAGVGGGDELLVLPGAGHFIGPPGTPATVDRNTELVSGGTPSGTGAGQRLAWTTALRFLDRTLGPVG